MKPSERIAELMEEAARTAASLDAPFENANSLVNHAIIAYLDEETKKREPPRRLCAECRADGQRSTVRLIESLYYAVNVSGRTYWDEDGVFHAGGRQPGRDEFQCSNGHRWFEDHRDFVQPDPVMVR